mmetsp:Transcript_67/g.154  ORF Transcript_67/g.154 Transcript_67/m.154 type:complete len:95 (+) Transcript_67:526-810(+)
MERPCLVHPLLMKILHFFLGGDVVIAMGGIAEVCSLPTSYCCWSWWICLCPTLSLRIAKRMLTGKMDADLTFKFGNRADYTSKVGFVCFATCLE